MLRSPPDPGDRASLEAYIAGQGLARFIVAVDRAWSDRTAVAASLDTFRRDPDLLIACLSYARLRRVLVAVKPESFTGIQRFRLTGRRPPAP